jgi:dienelactone hydrolase
MNLPRFPLLFLLLLLAVAREAHAQRAPATAADLEIVAKQFVELLVQEEYNRATVDFDKTMKRVMPSAKVEEVWKEILNKVGPFRSQQRTRTEKVAKYDIVYVTCEFEKLALDVKVVFDSERKISGLFFQRAQATSKYTSAPYANLGSLREREIAVGTDPWALPGILTLPTGNGPFPGVVLVHGSGPNDRDETVGANKPFKDLALGLATRGIAVLRYDKRTYAHRAKMAQATDSLTVKEEVIDDVFTAVRLLKQHPAIDAKRIFVVGHSLGGYLAPRMAHRDRDALSIAGYVIMAGNTRGIDELLWDQTNYVLTLDGSLSDDDKQKLEEIKKQIDRIREPDLSKHTSSGTRVLGASAAYWLNLRDYDPAAVAATLTQPMLILQGERDYQVTMKDFEGWKRLLSSRDNVVFKSYPRANHLFVEGEGKSTPAEYQTPGHVAQQVVEDIAAWIKRQ